MLSTAGAVGGVDVRGSAPGTRETDLLDPVNTVDQVHAVLLSGGSAFGLDAASGVMRWLEERGHGFKVGPVTVPIVPAAVLFDLYHGDPRVRPDADGGYAACEAASAGHPQSGRIGAGAGAMVGKLAGISRAMPGGIGSASVRLGDVVVGALIAVNAIGDVVDPASGRIIAGARTADGTGMLGSTRAVLAGELSHRPAPGGATTIGVIATNATLTKAQACKLAQMAHDGLARCIDPVHTAHDGDTLFSLATGQVPTETGPNITALGMAAAQATTLAVLRAVRGT